MSMQVTRRLLRESPDENESDPETCFVEKIVRKYTDANVITDHGVPAIPVTSSSIQTHETNHGTIAPYSLRSDVEVADETPAHAHAHPELEVTERWIWASCYSILPR